MSGHQVFGPTEVRHRNRETVGSSVFAQHSSCGVTGNFGALDKYSSRALPHLFVHSPLTLLHSPFPISLYPFTSLPSPPYSQPFPSLSLSPLPVIASSGFGERYSSPAGPGRARPSNEFCAIYSPTSANLLKVSPTCTRRTYTSVSWERCNKTF